MKSYIVIGLGRFGGSLARQVVGGDPAAGGVDAEAERPREDREAEREVEPVPQAQVGGDAAAPDDALRLYNHFVVQARQSHPDVQTGQFAADMQVHLVNNGPVTIPLRVD